jgi:putative phosphoesterase
VRIGVISDTHGLLRPEALAALGDCALILHGGDIGGPDILGALERIAPVIAVRGNNDRDPWAEAIAETEVVRAGGAAIYLIHDAKRIRVDVAGYAAVVAGHSHKPLCETRAGVLWFNPGSAGPRRFKLPVSVGYLHVDGASVRGELRTLST